MEGKIVGRPSHALISATPPPSTPAAASNASYDGLLSAVFGLALEITGDTAVAETLTSATFASLHTLAPTPSATLLTCLLADVHRRAVQWARDEGGTHGTDTAAIAAAAAQLIDLEEDERNVILDAYFGGFTYAEIAARRDLEAATVATLMQRGLRAIAAQRRGLTAAR